MFTSRLACVLRNSVARAPLRGRVAAAATVRCRGVTHIGKALFRAEESDGDESVQEIFMNNEKWRHEMESADPEFFKRWSRTQKPRYLWIGCSDSRTPAEVLCGLPYGSLFVHRNIANMVVNSDASAMSVIQYAVEQLKVQHIVLCGHYNCGGITASLQNVDHGSPLENWLRNIKDVYRIHRTELDAIDNAEARHRRLVELNVVEQAINIYKTRVVQKRRVETHDALDEYGFVQPRIHPVVYDPATGELKHLHSNIKKTLEELTPIYTIYETEGVEHDEGQFSGMGSSMVTPDILGLADDLFTKGTK